MLARKLVLGFGLAVLIPMLIHYGIDYGIDVVSPQPRFVGDYPEYHEKIYRLYLQERAAVGEEQQRFRKRREQLIRQLDALREKDLNAWSDWPEKTNKIRVLIGAPSGIAVTLLGSCLRVQAISGGVMLGGMFTLAWNYLYYWRDLSRVEKFSLLMVAFGVLLWIGYRRLSELKQPKRRVA